MVRVGLLVCDHVSGEFLPIAGDYPEMFGRFFAAEPAITLVPYDLTAGQFPSSPQECDGWITTGSRLSVYDAVDWIEAMAGFVRRIIDAGRPYVGVCFGHQMIAQALGGKVERAGVGWGVGIKEVKVPEPPAWLGVDSYLVLNSHADQIVDLPQGAEVLGFNDHCPTSMIALGDDVVGIQGHPEVPSAYVEALVRARRGAVIPDDVSDEALDSLRHPPDTEVLAHAIARFLVDRSP